MNMRIQKFNYSADLLRAILWQYDNAPNILSLVQRQQAWFDKNHTKFWEDWYDNVFNLDTANDFGLVVWSIILGLPLFIEISPDAKNKPIFGFEQYYENFDNGVFTSELQNGFNLTQVERRIILKLRYFYLTTRGAIPEINENFDRIFKPLGKAVALEDFDMHMTYQLFFSPTPNFLRALTSYAVLPTPAAVGYDILISDIFRELDDEDRRITDNDSLRIID